MTIPCLSFITGTAACFSEGSSDFRIRQILESNSGFSTYLWCLASYLLRRLPYLSYGVTRCLIGLDNSDMWKSPHPFCSVQRSYQFPSRCSESTCWVRWIWILSSLWVLLALQLMLSIYHQQSRKCKCETLEMVSVCYKADLLRAWQWTVSSAFMSCGPVLMQPRVLGGHGQWPSWCLIDGWC